MTPVLFKRETREVASFLCLSGALLFVPLTGVYPVFVMQMMCYALFACAFNLLLGYGGLLSFGQAMFLGTGGYVAGHILKVWGAPPELGLMAGVVCASALAFATGVLAIRRQGIYFAMITLALSQLVFFVFPRAPCRHRAHLRRRAWSNAVNHRR
jgi:branched-chain amino acid transport system permease protein